MRSPFSIIVIFTALCVAGLSLAPRLPLQYLPREEASRITVSYSWPNAAPEAIEREVSTALEGVLDLVGGVQRIYSISGEGRGSIRLDLEKGADPGYLRFEIAMRIRQLFPSLPEGVSFPEIRVNRPDGDEGKHPLLSWSLSGDDEAGVLYHYAQERLVPQLALNRGLERIELSGGEAPEWLILYDEDRLRALGLKPGDLRQALRSVFGETVQGTAAGAGGRIFPVRMASPAPETTAEWKHIPIAQRSGRLIRLGDLADAAYAKQAARSHYRVNGKTSIRLLLYPARGVNNIALAREMRRRLKDLAAGLPSSYRLRLEEDNTAYLRAELSKIRDRSLLSLTFLLAFALLAYRSLRFLLLTVLGLAANLGLAFILYYAFRVELHLYALAGITVSFGLITDNTIVMIHHLRRNSDRRVFPALLASTLTTLAALAAIFFLPEQWRLSLLGFARVLLINLSVSLAVAWWLIPALTACFGLQASACISRPGAGNPETAGPEALTLLSAHERTVGCLLRHRRKCIALAVLAFGLPVFLLPGRVKGWEAYNRTVGGDYFADHIRPVINKVLGGTLRLFVLHVYEKAAYRQPEETVLYVRGSMPPGATLEQLDAAFRQLEKQVGQFPEEVRQYATQLTEVRSGLMHITFNPEAGPAFPHLLRARLTAFCLNIGGIDWLIYGVGRSFGTETGASTPRFRVRLSGYDKDELEKQAQRFADLLREHPRIKDVNTEANIGPRGRDRHAYSLTIDRRETARQNRSPTLLQEHLESFNHSDDASLFSPDGTKVRLLPKALPQNDLWLLKQKQLQENDSVRLRLSGLTALEKVVAAGALHKENQQFIRMAEFEYAGSPIFGNRYLDQVMAQMRLGMPMGYSIEKAGPDPGGDGRQLYKLTGLVAALIFLICAVTFESLRQAAAVVLLIPLSFIGIFLSFYCFGFPFDQGGYASFFLVSGLTVNSLILILNEYNGSLNGEAGHPGAGTPAGDIKRYALAYSRKISPVLLTLLSTSLGLIPFMIDGRQEPFWFSLAAGTIGGLLFSVLAITWVIPLFLLKNRRM